VNENIIIRPETSSDYGQIKTVTREAFQDSGELVSELVELIRASINYVPELSLVAEVDNKIVGHIMLSHLNLQDQESINRVLTLSPISVLPEFQKNGIGGNLIREAIRKADELGEPLIVLEGSPVYYPRFGFKPAKEFGISIDLPDWAPEEAAMVLPLRKYNSLTRGKVIYPSAFDKVNLESHSRKK
jgi:putative acetyltransferase